MNMDARAAHVTSTAMELFPTDVYNRIIHYAREATMDARSNAHYSPRIITPFFVGHAGYGKTSRMRQYAREMGIGYRERKLAGITDISEVFGMVRTDPQTGETKHAAPSWWPDPTKEPEGMIVFDDATRCHNFIWNAVMQLMIDGCYNDLVLPEGWFIVCTGNPPEDYSGVIELDAAQSSRTLMIAYNRPNEVFYEQLERQDIHSDLKNLWMKSGEADAKVCTIALKPENNDRLKVLFGRIYPYLQGDDIALNLVANTMFGSGFVSAINAMRSQNKPMEPEDILNRWEELKDTFIDHVNNRRTDVVSITTTRLITYLSTHDPESFTLPQLKNVSEFGCAIPEANGKEFIDKVCSTSLSSGTRYSQRILEASKTAKDNGPFAARMADLTRRITQKMAAAGLR